MKARRPKSGSGLPRISLPGAILLFAFCVFTLNADGVAPKSKPAAAPRNPAHSFARPALEMAFSGHADSLLADSTALPDLAAYAAVEAAAGSGFLNGHPLLLLHAGDSLRYFGLSQPGAKPKALPPLPFRPANSAISPEGRGDTLLLTRDEKGDEEFQLYGYVPRMGRPFLWPMPPGRASAVTFAPGGRRFVYSHNPAQTQNEKATPWTIRSGHFDPRPQDRLLFRGDGIWTPADIDATGRHLLLLRTVSAFQTELYWLRRKSEQAPTSTFRDLQALPPRNSAVTVAWAKWLEAPSEKTSGVLVLLADAGGEYPALFTLRPGDSLRALSPPCDCEVENAVVLPRSHRVVYALNRQAVSELYLADADSGWVKPITGLPPGVLVHMQPDSSGRRLLLTMTHFGTPGDLYLHDFDTGLTTLWLKAPGLEQLPPARFPVAAPIRMSITPVDPLPPPQTRLPVWLLKPENQTRSSPLLIHIHGGPEMQARPGWDALDRYAQEQWGFALAYPDLRGSAGYGRAYLGADDQGRRPKVLRDLGAILDSLASLPGIDAGRIGLSGRSYGGFVTQAGALDFGSRLKSAIATVGISDFASFLQGTRGYRRDLRRMEYGDERDSLQQVFLDSISPLRGMSQLKIPLMLIHGRQDPRVPYAQSESTFALLSRQFKPALLLTENEEGHAARSRQTRLRQMTTSMQWLVGTLNLSR